MASLGHVAVGLLVGRVHGGRTAGEVTRSMVAFSGLAMLPDLDWLGVSMGVPDVGPAGHRGYTHSIVFALAVAALAGALTYAAEVPARKRAAPDDPAHGPGPDRRGRGVWTTLLVFLAVVSHPLLDSLCSSSRGVHLLWPFVDGRVLLPWRPIPGAPTGLDYVSVGGAAVGAIELFFFAPVLVAAAFWKMRPGGAARSWRGGGLEIAGVVATVALCMFAAELWLGHTAVVAWLASLFTPEMTTAAR